MKMSKILLNTLSCLLIIQASMFGAQTVNAENSNTATMDIAISSNDNVKLDDTFTVTVSINNVDEFVSCGVSLVYDADVVAVDSIAKTSIDGLTISCNDTGNSVKYGSYVNGDSSTYVGDLFTVTFKVIDDNVDSCNFSLDGIELKADISGTDVLVSNSSSISIPIYKEVITTTTTTTMTSPVTTTTTTMTSPVTTTTTTMTSPVTTTTTTITSPVTTTTTGTSTSMPSNAVMNMKTSSKGDVKIGNTFTVTVSMNNVDEFVSCGLSLVYDADVVAVDSIEKTSIDGLIISCNDTGNSVKYGSYVNGDSSTYVGDLFTVTFKVIDDNADSCNFSLDGIELKADISGTNVLVSKSSDISIPIHKETITTTISDATTTVNVSKNDDNDKDKSSPKTNDSIPMLSVVFGLLSVSTIAIFNKNRN